MCSPFFGYYKHIITELEKLDFTVDYYNDRPSEGQFQKGLIRMLPFLTYPSIVAYFNSILKKTYGKDYDVVLIINNKVLTEDFLVKLHSDHPKAYFIFYTWDSVHLYPSTVNLLSYFDIAYSFDPVDCKRINGLHHLALFYTYKHQGIGETLHNLPNITFKYDISSVGTAHPNRYTVLKKLIPYLEKRELSVFSYLYIQPIRFAFSKLFVPEFRHARIKEFQFKELSEIEMINSFKQSKIILDIPHFGQSGLTMRTIETLGSKRKLITYNTNIEHYDFYNTNNILILNETNWDSIDDFIKIAYEPLDPEIYQKYSITQWIETLFETWTYSQKETSKDNL
jgi:hypothetical protein